MFSHLFFYRLKCLLRDKDMLFWTVIFPIILISLMHFTITNIPDTGAMPAIPLAVVDSQAYEADSAFSKMLESYSKGENTWLDLRRVDKTAAIELLSHGDIVGYIEIDKGYQWNVNSSGLQQSIVKLFLYQYTQTSAALAALLQQTPQALSLVPVYLEDSGSLIEKAAYSDHGNNLFLIVYFAWIAMACFYGGYFGLYEAIEIQADLSSKAARLNIGPIHKLKGFLANSSASLTIHYGGLLLLLAFLNLVLNVDFGRQYPYLLLLCLVGSVLAIMLGCLISLLVKGSENTKNAFVTAISMLGSFLAGLMIPAVKTFIDTKLPLLSWLNPVGLLADGCYALYFYDDYSNFWLKLSVLGAFTLAAGCACYLIIRRQKYDSI